MTLWFAHRERQGEVAILGDMPVHRRQTSGAQHILAALLGELAADLGAHLLTLGKRDRRIESLDTHGHVATRPQDHLDVLAIDDIARHVLELIDRKVSPKLAVDDVQDVEIELGGDALGIVAAR